MAQRFKGGFLPQFRSHHPITRALHANPRVITEECSRQTRQAPYQNCGLRIGLIQSVNAYNSSTLARTGRSFALAVHIELDRNFDIDWKCPCDAPLQQRYTAAALGLLSVLPC